MLARIGAKQEANFTLFSSPPVDLFKALEITVVEITSWK